MSREAGEEIQLAETKLAMHKEMLEKDEQVRAFSILNFPLTLVVQYAVLVHVKFRMFVAIYYRYPHS